MAGRFGLEGAREVGSQSGERRRGDAAVTGRGIARQGSRRRAGGARPAGGGGTVAERPEEEDEGWGPCVSEGRKGEGPVGRLTGGLARGRGEVEAGRGEEGEGRPAGRAGPKAKWASKARRAESEK
jgi:hypothetical protein